MVGVLDGEPGGLGDLRWGWRRWAGGQGRRPVGWPLLEGMGWWGRRRRRSRGRGGWRRWGRGNGERRWVLAAVRGGGRCRGRGGGASELRRPVRLGDAARVCWRGRVPQRLQGGRGARSGHFTTHTHTRTHTHTHTHTQGDSFEWSL